jgi:hypothetical protein
LPAKKKHLSSGRERVSKVFAAILGSYLAAMSIHLAAIKLSSDESFFLITAAYSSFLVWVVLMIIAFLFKKSVYSWALFIGVTLVGLIVVFV